MWELGLNWKYTSRNLNTLLYIDGDEYFFLKQYIQQKAFNGTNFDEQTESKINKLKRLYVYSMQVVSAIVSSSA